MICQECGKILTNEEDCCGHDCEVEIETTITQKKFRNKTTGEIVTQFSILDINNFEEVK